MRRQVASPLAATSASVIAGALRVREMNDRGNVTGLLNAWQDGDAEAGDTMLALIYDELHRIAAQQRRRGQDLSTLQTTDLLHEAWLRLSDQGAVNWRNRSQFFAIASVVIRRVLLDYARRRKSQQRDRRMEVPLADSPEPMNAERAREVIELDAALGELKAHDPRQARVVELRYFGGLTIEETGSVLEVSPATVKRDWEHARAWLYRELHADEVPPP